MEGLIDVLFLNSTGDRLQSQKSLLGAVTSSRACGGSQAGGQLVCRLSVTRSSLEEENEVGGVVLLAW